MLCGRLQDLTPWQFSAYLGRMVDTSIIDDADFDEWFRQECQRLLYANEIITDFAEAATGEPTLDEGDRVRRVDDHTARIPGTIRYISTRGVVAVQWANGPVGSHTPRDLRVLPPSRR
ncbi:hypothetical protein HUW46_09253 [Amycolatopsis sp. CA-230715]|nr:hypothetical protein HUW46_09253 [Amycolatopsis sp. CA-230715]